MFLTMMLGYSQILSCEEILSWPLSWGAKRRNLKIYTFQGFHICILVMCWILNSILYYTNFLVHLYASYVYDYIKILWIFLVERDLALYNLYVGYVCDYLKIMSGPQFYALQIFGSIWLLVMCVIP